MAILRAGMTNDDTKRPTALQLRDALIALQLSPPGPVLIPPLGSPPLEPVYTSPPLPPPPPPPPADRLLDSPFLGGFSRDPELTVPHEAGPEEPPTDPLTPGSGIPSSGSGAKGAAGPVPGSGAMGSGGGLGSGGGFGSGGTSGHGGGLGSGGAMGSGGGLGSGGASGSGGGLGSGGSAAGGGGSSGFGGPGAGLSGSGGSLGGAAAFGGSSAPVAPPADPFVGASKPLASRRGLWIGVTAGLLAAVALVGVAIAYGLGDATPGPTPSASAIAAPPTSTCGPVADTGAHCSSTPECFDADFAPADCTGRHSWEVFAYGDLPAGSKVTDKKDQRVAAVCSIATLVSVNIAAANWDTDVLLPSAAAQKAVPTTFRCLAGRGANALTGEQLHRGR
jgi:hypothetical protein